MTESFIEIIRPAQRASTIWAGWRRIGCQCLRKPWAEPWTDEHGMWYTYHKVTCRVVRKA